ncbi:MAG: glycosyltransferase [Vulcanimicrobiaceae bacterium]
MKLLQGLCVFASAAFAVRAIDIALRSNDAVPLTCEGRALPPLSVIVPARNEERQIERCVRSLLAQRYDDFEVIVVDDRSEDRTFEIVDRIALEDARVRLVRGEPLPAGWVGKPWALHQGAQHARGAWLLFTDADTFHEPAAAASAVSYAVDAELDVLSLLSRQELGSLAERALLPSILFTIAFAIGPLDALNDPRNRNVALLNGQYVLMRRDVHDAIGGHAAVRAQIAEDFELAHLLKREGYRTVLAGATDLVRTRMYRSAREIWSGFTKNLALGARGNPFALVAGVAALACISPLPEIVLARAVAKKDARGAALMLGAIALSTAAAEIAMRRARFPAGSGLWLPAGMAATVAIAVNSALRFASGRGVDWRGRRYRAQGIPFMEP